MRGCKPCRRFWEEDGGQMQVQWGRSPALPTEQAGERPVLRGAGVGAGPARQAAGRQQAGRQWRATGAEGRHTGKRTHAQEAGLSQGKSPGSMLFTLILQEGAEPASIEHCISELTQCRQLELWSDWARGSRLDGGSAGSAWPLTLSSELEESLKQNNQGG